MAGGIFFGKTDKQENPGFARMRELKLPPTCRYCPRRAYRQSLAASPETDESPFRQVGAGFSLRPWPAN